MLNGSVRLIDLETGEIEQKLRIGPPGGVILSVAYAPDGRHLVTANANGTAYVIRIPPSPVEVTEVSGSDWLDLLQFPIEACDVIKGERWIKQEGFWTTAGVPNDRAQLVFPVAPRGGYDLTAEVSRRGGANRDICFFLPIGAKYVVLGFNHEGGTVAGLSDVRGVACWVGKGNSTTVKHEPFPVGKKISITVSVRVTGERAEVTARADGVPPIKWSGPVTDLGRNALINPPDSRLGVDVLQTRYLLHSLKFRRVDGVAKVYRRRPLPPVDPDRKAAEWVLSIGGVVQVNGEERDINVAGELPREPFRLTQVNLRENKQVSDAGLAHFRGCKGLTHLDLWGTQVGDAGLAHLKDCKDLTYLDLGRTKVGDAGLVYFKDCKNLTNLLLYDARQVGDAGLSYFKGCNGLEHVNLTWTKVSNRGLTNLKGWKNLHSLGFEETQVSDLSPLKGLPLASVSLKSTKVTDLSPLKGMPLKELRGDFKPERDANILRSIKTLETINGKPVKEFWKEVEAKKP